MCVGMHVYICECVVCVYVTGVCRSVYGICECGVCMCVCDVCRCVCGTIKCELFNKLGGYNKDLYSGGADRDFWISVFESNEEGVCINKIIYERRIRENSFGYKRSNKRHLVAQILVDGHPEYFSDINRENICLSKGFEQSARFHRKIGKRKKAMELAQVAIDYGSKNESLTNIIYEGNMSIGRYILRRIGRFIK